MDNTQASSFAATSTTVISFFVNVPVLSEQITVIEPNVSTEGSPLMIAFSFAISCTPTDRIMVKTAGNPSGTIDTTKAIVAERRICQSIPYRNVVKITKNRLKQRMP